MSDFMKLRVRALVAIASVFAGLTAASAQSALTPPPKKAYKYDGKIVSTYDANKDQTIVLMQLMPVKSVEEPRYGNDPDFHGKTAEQLSISFYFAYPGKVLATPKFATVGILYMALDPQVYESHLLSAKVDGQWIQFGKMEVLKQNLVTVRGDPSAYKPYTRRALELNISYENLLRLANAKKVKMKLGDYDFDLSRDQMDALRDLASRSVP